VVGAVAVPVVDQTDACACSYRRARSNQPAFLTMIDMPDANDTAEQDGAEAAEQNRTTKGAGW